ncbi:MAG: hypothetical protein K2K80_03220 [Clostridia bacterium]|nr:hypothetical protein [Clostridia bacterium]
MKAKSVICAVSLAEGLSIDDMPFENRSDEWWDEFWRVMGLREAQRIREALCE